MLSYVTYRLTRADVKSLLKCAFFPRAMLTDPVETSERTLVLVSDFRML